MREPLQVHGVGNGSQTAGWQISLPIAVTDVQGETSLHNFQAPIIGGGGAGLPALLGLGSMQAKKAILNTDPENPMLIFPRSEPPKMEFGPGAVLIPLRAAPSGHLCMPAGNYSLLTVNTGGLRRPQMHMLAASPPTSSSSAEQATTGEQPADPAERGQCSWCKRPVSSNEAVTTFCGMLIHRRVCTKKHWDQCYECRFPPDSPDSIDTEPNENNPQE